MSFEIVLFEPEIPPNTGNIIRLCANTGARLHLIRPFGFEWDDTRLKRAGLDYHDLAHVTLYDNLQAFMEAQNPARIFACTTKGSTNYTNAEFVAGDTLIFGPETRGLPAEFLDTIDNQYKLRIPMQADSRSLNLANSVAVIMYEAWRQIDFLNGV